MLRKEQAYHTKMKIVTEAANLFFTKGYEQATMQDIMSIAQLSKGALYHHFKSKQEILEFATNLEQESITEFIKNLVINSELSSSQKIENLINYFENKDSLLLLTQNKWAEKVPFALLHTLRNTLNVLSGYIEEIINQGNITHEFNCKFPKEVAEIFLLLIDIWLDPVIVNSTYLETCRKIDFIIVLLNKFETPLISIQKGQEMKERMKNYYDK